MTLPVPLLRGDEPVHPAAVVSPGHARRRGVAASFGAEDLDTTGVGDPVRLVLEVMTDGRVRSGAAVRVEDLLDAAGGVGGLLRADTATLVAVGFTPRAARRLVAAVELGRRALQASVAAEIVGSYDAVVRWARPRIAHLDHEEVWVLLLDGRNRLRTAARVAQGGLHACALTPADVLRPAIRGAASALVLVHNHPSGDPEPSGEDVAMTRAVAAACEVVAVPLLDHVIVARDGAASLFGRGLVPRVR
ncbi:MAG: DNA repair protein [Polyangiaceae bacterium]|nr:DNA repair protein [Polyangiaceae bacterium]